MKEGGLYEKGDIIGGKYEVHNILGRGGYGKVYLVYSFETNSVYALKTLHDRYLSKSHIKERFRQEARIWIDLGNHPYIVRAYHLDEVDERLCIAMEYVAPNESGLNSLDRYLEHRPPDLTQMLRWSIQCCHGMEYASSKGMRCHRDIKADNVMITRDEIAKITDFSIAGAFEEVTTPSGTGSGMGKRETQPVRHVAEEWKMGSPAHMPPEQFVDPASCDQRSDIYSFGVVLFEMASGGEFPFLPPDITREELASPEVRKKREFWETMYELHRDAMPPPLDSTLSPLIQKCLKKSRKDRYQAFGELREALASLLKRETGEEIASPLLQDYGAWEWNNRGVSLDFLGRHEEAIRCYDRALEIEPENAKAQNNKGNSLDESGRHEEAIRCYDRALEMDPGNAKAQNNKGVSLQSVGRYEEALRCFDRALELNNRLIDAWNNKGACLQTIGRPTNAIHCFDRALEIEPENAKAQNNKGVSLQSVGRYEEAALCHDRSLKSNPGDAKVWSNIGNCFGNLGRHEEAIRCYDRALEIDPTLIKAWNNKGNIFRDLHRLEEAIGCFERALEIDSGYAGAWFNRALAEMEMGKKKRAIDSFERFISLSSSQNSKFVDFARKKINELER